MQSQAIVFFVAISFLSHNHVVTGLLRCNLHKNIASWGFFMIGSDIPEGAINLGGLQTNSYIANADLGDGPFIGTFHEKDKIGYFPFPTGDPELSAFSLLRNLENCTIKWVNAPSGTLPPDFAVQSPSGAYLGRILLDGYYHAGQVNFNVDPPEFLVAVKRNQSIFTSDYQVLTSFSAGLEMTMEDVEILLEPETDDVNAMAVEEIRNNGNAAISQTIQHKKTIKEVYSNTISNTHSTSNVHTCGWGFNIILASKSTSYTERHTYTETKQETWTTEKITEIDLQRTITVPPFESVQVCSVVSIRDKIDIEYEGNIVYTAPGLTAEEIAEILATDPENPIQVNILNGRAVLPKVKGKFRGSVAMQSAFFVVDLKMGMGCLEYAQNQVKKNSQEWRTLKPEMQRLGYNATA